MSSLVLPEPDTAVLIKRNPLLKGLKKAVPNLEIISDEDGRRAFETDALTAYKMMPMAVVLPVNTDQVSGILSYCNQHNIKVVPRGAGTSLCGGALPCEDSIVVGLSRMNRVLDVDFPNRTATVQTGITNLGISNAVEANRFFYAPDPSSQLACTLGGNIAMNSGGAHCLKYGVTTNNILGLKVVLIDGEVVEIGGGYLDQPGYDLIGLFVGSEGQFGIVTEATVRILKSPEAARPMLMGFQSSEDAGDCVAAIIASGIIPVALEFMDKPAIHVCENFANAGYPLDVEALLIVEVEGAESEIDRLLDQISTIAQDFNPSVIRISQSPEESLAIWKGRKSAFGAMGQISDYYCMDGTIPTNKLSDVLSEIARICARHNLKVANIFHAGDGNLHPLVLYDANDADEVQRAEEAGAEILKHCVRVGGCLTGEHGVGVEKRDIMYEQFSTVDMEQQTRIKSAFDPNWLLNPGKVFPLDETPHSLADRDS
ncbi:MAG: FAD-linked oxidase C-terminal domain-containing protein [Methyloligellaceae bacterium]